MVVVSVLNFLFLATFCKGAKVLVVIPTPAFSHATFASVLYEELAHRGHEVTAFTGYPSDTKHANLKEIELSKPITIETDITEALNANSVLMNFYLQWKFLQACDKVYTNKEMQKLLLNGTFDLVMIEWNVVPCFSILAEHFKAPLIGIRSLGLRLEGYDYIANPTNPSYISIAYNRHTESFWGRLNDLLFSIYWRLQHNLVTIPKAQQLVQKYFPSYTGSVVESEKKVALIFTNTHYVINGVRPNVPAIVELGLLHVGQKKKPLTEDLNTFLNENPYGFVFFNLGTLIKTKFLDSRIFQHFGKLPFNFLIKLDSSLDNLPRNVKMDKWFQNEAILTHPNIKLFITHGGLLSLQEAIYHEVPMIVIPFLFDQPYNAYRMEELGIGKTIQYRDVGGPNFLDAILNVTADTTYKVNIKYVSKLVKDHMLSPKDKAIWWVEYVLRHRGAPYIKSKAVHMNWFTYLLLDVVFFLIVIIYLICFLANKFFTTIKKIKTE
ncbi:PREDICTED: UDP-glucuronosyltransferase 2B10-like [Nicrophorus vespilloides]|uniref:UDP-glucuronosyltransferase 2B10-like n=1 Tax=Nicrophorus vespilloides TaxID=110193 RepID=A0ABM1NDB6_NICVS|nr:PREDICTED: UDP-glucuronosyltransferase 2B10-like [Nicrophorus vespilloides]